MPKTYTIKYVAEKVGVHSATLRKWEESGKISPAKRLARNNTRIYTDDDIQRILEWKNKIIEPDDDEDMEMF